MRRPALVAALAGVLFGFGLMLSGMANPQKVQNFLDLSGHWDPTLAFVMAGALTVALPGFWCLRRWPRAWSGDRFQLPARRDIDGRLLLGAALFGIGWGLSGYCPGPAIASLAFFSPDALGVVLALAAGTLLHDRLLR